PGLVAAALHRHGGIEARVELEAIGLREQAAHTPLLVGLEEVAAVDQIRKRQHPGPALVRATVVREAENRDTRTGLPQRATLGLHAGRREREGGDGAAQRESPAAHALYALRHFSKVWYRPTPSRSSSSSSPLSRMQRIMSADRYIWLLP